MNYYHPRNALIVASLYLMDNWVKAYTGIPLALLLDSILFLLCIRLLGKRSSYKTRLLLIIIFIVFLVNFLKIVSGISMIITSRGILMLFLFVYLALDYVDKSFSIYLIIKYFKNYLSILVLFVFIDGVYINFIGSSSFFINLFGVAGYAMLGNAVFFDSVAQGIIPGSQHASIISCAGIIMFFPFLKGDFSTKNTIMFSVSIFCLLVSVTNTALLALVTSLLMYIFITFRFSMSYLFLISVAFISFFTMKKYWKAWLTMRYDILESVDDTMVDNFINNYFEIFLSPLKNINQLPIFYQLTGVGKSSLLGKQKVISEYFGFSYFQIDFGYLNMVLEQGLISMVLIFLLYLYYFRYLGRILRIMPASVDRIIMAKLIIIVNIFAISGIHYVTITKNGILQFIVVIGVALFIMGNRYEKRFLTLNRNSMYLTQLH